MLPAAICGVAAMCGARAMCHMMGAMCWRLAAHGGGHVVCRLGDVRCACRLAGLAPAALAAM